MAWAVKFEDVSKRFRLSSGYGSLRDELVSLGRKTLPFRRGAEARPREILALDRVSFEVEEGQAFAIIGPNGSGKTTSLKLLARITYPTTGCVRLRGRVGALIEVGAGIHPELTGRENIWLYGRIMGMCRDEIKRRFDEIVEFAELAHVLDTPVKRYSSGMHLRLGFAIASHLDPGIFVVDEALAVGDAGFQAKCVERMMQLVAEGRTLLFVSHNLPAVESLCPSGLFLCDGQVVAQGSIREVLRQYLDWTEKRVLERRPLETRPTWKVKVVETVEIVAASCHDAAGRERYEFTSSEPVEIRLRFRTRRPLQNPHINIGISDGRPGVLIHCSTFHSGEPPKDVASEWTTACRIEKLHLMPRLYHVWCEVSSEQSYDGHFCALRQVTAFKVVGEGESSGRLAVTLEAVAGAVRTDYNWIHTVK
jgi:lipopolysaccharide transport system ATP-binding protein